MNVVDAIEQAPVNGEAPVNRIDLRAVKIVRLGDVVKVPVR